MGRLGTLRGFAIACIQLTGSSWGDWALYTALPCVLQERAWSAGACWLLGCGAIGLFTRLCPACIQERAWSAGACRPLGSSRLSAYWSSVNFKRRRPTELKHGLMIRLAAMAYIILQRKLPQANSVPESVFLETRKRLRKGRARCCPADLNGSEFADLRHSHSRNIGGGHFLE